MPLRRATIGLILAVAAAPVLGQMTDPGPPSQAALESALSEAVRGSCPGLRYSIDPALSLAAAGFAHAVEQGRVAPSGAALAFFASLESVEPMPTSGVATIEPASQAERAVGDLFSRACHFDRVGVAVGRYQDGAVVALLTAHAQIELGALPGRADPGQRVTVQGRLAAGLTSPRLFVLKPDGSVESRELGDKRQLSASVVLEERGEHSVEVLAVGPGGPQVVALRRIFVGVDPPRAPPAEPPVKSAGSGLEAVTEAIAALRAGRGLPPLRRDAALDAVAAGHSAEMARTRTFAHVLPSDQGLTDRLFRAAYGYRFAGENIGLAETALQAHEAVAQSPAHLANLLDPRHRRLGLGAVAGVSPEGSPGIYLTEVLAAPIVGLADPAGAVRKLVDAERDRRGLAPLERDPRLDQFAEQEVRTAAESGDAASAPDTARRALHAATGLTGVTAELSVGTAPEDVLRSKSLGSPDWTHLGVGALYASSPTLGPSRLWVMLVLAR